MISSEECSVHQLIQEAKRMIETGQQGIRDLIETSGRRRKQAHAGRSSQNLLTQEKLIIRHKVRLFECLP